MKSSPLSEQALVSRLRERFAAPAYAFLPGVRNGTGTSRRVTRTADALAMSLWPSRGLELHGFECKSARSDWVKERDDPSKAEEIARFCHRWWLVVGSEDLVQPGELPAAWGLLVPRGEKLVAKVEAPKLEAQPLDLPIICAILRRITEDCVPRAHVDAEVAKGVKEAAERHVDTDARRIKMLEQHVEQLTKAIGDFEARSGVLINQYNGPQLGEAVAFVMQGALRRQIQNLTYLRNQAEQILKVADGALSHLGKGAD